ncbi:MAG: SusC/RagA family TonB-linked outer membrane protein [Tannerellaceae bacterium]|nr:SusC/RagA family TonB-linked outer membrane protein [Tannerellaceae bacterium]
MKISVALLFSAFLQLSAMNGYAQKARISISMSNASIEEVLNKIEENSEFVFLYNDKTIQKNRMVSVLNKSGKIPEILDDIFNDTNIAYTIVDKQIILSTTKMQVVQQEERIRVSGIVKDQSGEPLIGVNIKVKNVVAGTITDADGRFTLSVKRGDLLEFSYIGYAQTSVTVVNDKELTIVLEEDFQAINEVVVTALGIRKEQKAVGYVTQKLSGNNLIQANSPNIGSALSGKLAGVNINNANQLDGGSTRIVIRGNNNIQGNNQPLIILDGIPIENNADLDIASGSINENTGTPKRDMGTGLNFINPADIEDMTVLKGPAAAALYGARGGNGVILITTKKGSKKEGLGIDYSYTAKMTNPYRYQKKQTDFGYGGPQYSMYTANTELEKNADGVYMYPRNDWGGRYAGIYGTMPGGKMTWEYFDWHPYATTWGAKIEGQNVLWWDGEMRKYEPQPDNQKYYYDNALSTTHNVSFSNAGDFGSVRVGLSHADNEAVVPNSDYKQTTVTLGSNMNISKRIKAEVMASYNDYNRHNIFQLGNQNTSFSKFGYLFPGDYIPELDYKYYKKEDGSKQDLNQVYAQRGYPYGEGANIFWEMYENNYDMQRNQLLGSIKLDYEATDWLRFMIRTTLDFNNTDIAQRNKPTDIEGTQGFYYRNLGKDRVMNSDVMGTLHKEGLFADRFDVNFTAGATRWDRKMYGMSASSGERFKDPWIYNFSNYDLSYQSEAIMSRQVPEEKQLHKRINSIYGFLDLDYKDLLYLQVTGRNDWSSTLPTGSNSYFYPSASLSFVFSELIGRKPVWFNFGKARVAYASAATDTDPYQVIQTYSSGSFAGYPTHSLKNVLPPLNLKPQRSNSFEAGLAMSLFNYRWDIDFTFYNTQSYEQIMTAPIPQSSGYNSFTFNTGELRNRGFELITNFKAVQSRDLSLNIGLNLAHNQNRLLSMSEGADEFIIANIFGGNGPVIQVEVGDDYGNIYGWDYIRDPKGNRIIDVVYGEGEYSKTVIGTKYRMTSERVKLGNITPDLTGGLNLNLNYKNWNLYALTDFSWGGDLWSGSYATAMGSGISPATTKERNGGGLPYTYYTDGSTANHGIRMDGVLEDGTPNPYVVHYVWEYVPMSAYGVGNRTSESVFENNWIKMRELAVSYTFSPELIQKTKIFRSLRLSLVGRDLFYFYSSLPDRLNPEALSNTAGNAQGLEFGALPGMRSFSLSVNVGF